MLKAYHERVNSDQSELPIGLIRTEKSSNSDSSDIEKENIQEYSPKDVKVKLQNSMVLLDLDQKLGHLSLPERREQVAIILQFKNIFPDVPNRTTVAYHDVDVRTASPIKQHPYWLSPVKVKHLQKEIEYMLDNDIIEPSKSEWSSPCVLVLKPDGSYHRKVNSVTKTDSYPIPRIDDCIDKVGTAKFVSKFDMLKGYWQVPLTQKAK